MEYIISQVLGAIGCIFVFLSMQTKNIKYTMLCQIFCNGLGMLSYVLTDGFSGTGIYLIATLQSVVFFILRTKEKQEPKWIYPIIFAAYIGCSLLTFSGAKDIVPMAAALMCALALIQKKPAYYRIIILLNGTLWIIYDIFLKNYTMLASHIITVVSAIIGIIRCDILQNKRVRK